MPPRFECVPDNTVRVPTYRIQYLVADVSNPADAQRTVACAVDLWGRLKRATARVLPPLVLFRIDRVATV